VCTLFPDTCYKAMITDITTENIRYQSGVLVKITSPFSKHLLSYLESLLIILSLLLMWDLKNQIGGFGISLTLNHPLI